MKRVIFAAAAVLALTTTSAHAVYQCQPTYYQRYDSYYGTYIISRGRDNCVYYPDPIPQQPYVPVEPGYAAPPPGYYEGGYYEGPDAGAALVGGLIGFGLGYVVGDNNNNKKNNYYYYNKRNNYYYKKGNKKRYKYEGGWNNGQGRPQPRKPKNNN